MKSNTRILWAGLVLLSTLTSPRSTCFAQGTSFTYQGRLSSGSAGAAGLYDFRFAAYDAASGGTQIGNSLNAAAVGVTNGLFTVTLDFGVNVFTGAARWLELAAKTNASAAAFVPMTPRQPLLPTPYAIRAANANAVANGAVGGAQLAPNAVAQNHLAISGTPGPGKVVSSDGSGLVWGNAPTTAGAWGLSGNAGTTPGANFLGTTDNQPIVFRANGNQVLRIDSPDSHSANFVGGPATNSIAPGVSGSVIAGGGTDSGPDYNNTIAASSAFIGAGFGNHIGQSVGSIIVGGLMNNIWVSPASPYSDFASAIVGGQMNVIANDQWFAVRPNSFIGGGQGNTITNSQGAAILGGEFNHINTATHAAIGGGSNNRAEAVGATVPGGYGNRAAGALSFAAGQNAQALHAASFVWSDGADFASTATAQFSVRAGGGVRFNTAGAGLTVDGIPFGGVSCTNGGGYSMIGGGLFNSVAADSLYSAIPGGDANVIDVQASGSTIGGGVLNHILGDYALWSGGQAITATIGGGSHNSIGTNSPLATIAGGGFNTANNYAGAIGGGENNSVSGIYATVPGGRFNSASGGYALAAGLRAKAIHDGSFVWADSQVADFASTATNQFSVRAQNGARFVTGGAGVTVDGAPVLTAGSTNVATLTGSQTFTGANTFSNSLTVGTSAGQLTLQGESGIAVGIAGTGGPNPGHVRFRNALEVFPAANNSANGYLDVRSTNGIQVMLRGDDGSITTTGDANIGGNLSARNTPGVNYCQSSTDNIALTSTPTIICSEGNYKPATGFFLITAYIYGSFNGNNVNLSLVDVTGAPQVLTFVTADPAINGSTGNSFHTLNLNWVVPITSAGGYQNFGLQARTQSGTATIFSHNLTVLYVPRQNN